MANVTFENVPPLSQPAPATKTAYYNGFDDDVTPAYQMVPMVDSRAGHTTQVKEADVRGWVDGANKKVFSPQMNLTFTVKAVNLAPMKQDLGNPIDFSQLSLDMPYVKRDNKNVSAMLWHSITDSGDNTPSIFNVFCLWNFTASGGDAAGFVEGKQPIGTDKMAKSGANFNMCMIKDVNPNDDGIPYLIFAHEAGHFLEGFNFHYDNAALGLLMNRKDTEIGRRLGKRDIEAMTKRW